MSLVLAESPKHCGKKQGIKIDKVYKKLFYTFSIFFLSILTLILIVWLLLHPSKPDFSLGQVDIYQLNLSAPHLPMINSSIEITLQSNNPNKKVGIYYDKLQVYASYKGQQITADSDISPFYQGHEESNLLSVNLVGTGQPVGPSLGYELGLDRPAGKLVLSLKMDGRLRWKVGTWVSGRYRFDVNCVATVAIGPNISSGLLSPSKQGTKCSTSV